LEVDLRHVQNDQERELLKAAVAGDLDSFGELCQRYYAAMVAVAYAVLSDHQLAEDAAQESFARALVNLRRLQNKDRYAPWLAAICRNVARDMAAAKSRHVSAEDLSQVADKKHDNEDHRAIRRAIEQLPADARELVVLRYYNNLSYERIGAILGISPAAINGKLARVKRRIARHLRESDFRETRP
jgi:RNA polymerase sigma-70 factor (ECF subfamily)